MCIRDSVDTLWPKLLSLANLGAATAGELHQKFVDEAQGFDLEYAGLKSFFGGLEAVVGAPSPKVLEGMKADHCTSADSIFPFDTPNYKMTTTSRIEWWFVVHPKEGLSALKLQKYPEETLLDDDDDDAAGGGNGGNGGNGGGNGHGLSLIHI